MKKKLFLIICLLGALCLGTANNLISNDGLTIRANNTNGNDRSAFISASIDGHTLSVNFLSNIGHVTIKITNASGATLDIESTETPTGYMYYIPSAGHYVVVFTFTDGDEYYGEFDVTD